MLNDRLTQFVSIDLQDVKVRLSMSKSDAKISTWSFLYMSCLFVSGGSISICLEFIITHSFTFFVFLDGRMLRLVRSLGLDGLFFTL